MADPFSLSPDDTTVDAAGVGPIGDAGTLQKLAAALGQTWPAHMVKAALSAAALPGDVYSGQTTMAPPGIRREDVTDVPGAAQPADPVIGRAADLAGLAAGVSTPFAEPGAVGIFGGRLAKTADHAKLAQAEEMAAKGAFPDEVHAATGWFKGADDKWRFEIPDNAAKFQRVEGKNTIDNWPIDRPHETTLGAAFDHPELMAAYPDLKGVRLTFEEGSGGQLGSYRPKDPILEALDAPEAVSLSTRPTRYGDDKNAARTVALHELQHAVQAREGFARGGNPQEFMRGYSSIVRDANDQIEAINASLGKAVGTPRYDELLAMRSELVKEIQKIEGPNGIGVKEKGYADYKRVAGEVEARNVEHRADWDAQHRADVPPVYSQDVPNKDQIVRFGEPFSMAGPIKIR